jgi:hypothetical protein
MVRRTAAAGQEGCVGAPPSGRVRVLGQKVQNVVARSTVTNEDLQLALTILDLTSQRSKGETDPELQFALRVGMNQNSDEVVQDVNGAWDFLGAGINHCHEVMRAADAQQILVSYAAWHRLRSRKCPVPGVFLPIEPLLNKHGETLTLFEFRANPSQS